MPHDYLTARHLESGDRLVIHRRHDSGFALAWDTPCGRYRVGFFGECDSRSAFRLAKDARAYATRLGLKAVFVGD